MLVESLWEASRRTRTEAHIRCDRAARYNRLAAEMEAVFENWPMGQLEQFALSGAIASLRLKAARMLEARS